MLWDPTGAADHRNLEDSQGQPETTNVEVCGRFAAIHLASPRWSGLSYGRGPSSRAVGGRFMLTVVGRQQRGSKLNCTSPREAPRASTTALEQSPATQGFVVGAVPGSLDGMQGVRGSNPLSSTPSQRSSPPSTARESFASGSKLAAICPDRPIQRPVGRCRRPASLALSRGRPGLTRAGGLGRGRRRIGSAGNGEIDHRLAS